MTIQLETQRVLDQATRSVCRALDDELGHLVAGGEIFGLSPDAAPELRKVTWRPLAQGAVVRFIRALLDASTPAPLSVAEFDLVNLLGVEGRDEFARRVALGFEDADRVLRAAALALLESSLFESDVTLVRGGASFVLSRRAGRLVAVSSGASL